MTDEPIAELGLCLVAPDGAERLLYVRLQPPAANPRGGWSCTVSFSGDSTERPTPIHGDDSFQALSLALDFVRRRLRALQEQGFELRLPVSGEELPLDAYFPIR